ncbi:MAG: Tim44 domain-containing protein, partial [Comamonas sp.]
MMKVWAVVLVAALAVVHPSVEAKRMGGGGSMGKQSSNVTQRDAAPRAPQQAPAQQQAAPKPATPAAAPAAPA